VVPATGVNVSTTQALGNAAHPLIMHMNAFIARLAALSSDSHSAVRTAVCQAITTISSCHVAVLEPHFADICRFMLVALQDTDEGVAIESCEFWAVMVESEDTKSAIAPFLHTLVGHLIGRLYLTAEQMEQERVDEEEENSGEKELNLRPMHHRPGHSSGCGAGSGGGSSAEEDKENAELSARWTLRKQAALLLDTVAQSFPASEVLPPALARIQACFQDGSALVRESGVLALGALSTGEVHCGLLVSLCCVFHNSGWV
jgi:transportin-1